MPLFYYFLPKLRSVFDPISQWTEVQPKEPSPSKLDLRTIGAGNGLSSKFFFLMTTAPSDQSSSLPQNETLTQTCETKGSSTPSSIEPEIDVNDSERDTPAQSNPVESVVEKDRGKVYVS
jgi:hypothetical protein